MPNTPGVGHAIIIIASALLVFNFLGWLLFSWSLALCWLWPILWVVGILLAAIEPKRRALRNE